MARRPAPPADAEPVFASFWNRWARILSYGALAAAIMAPLGAIQAAVEGVWLYTVATVPFIAFFLAAAYVYRTERVYASPGGLHVWRRGSWRAYEWSRVGRPKPFLGFDSHRIPVLLHVRVEGERRPIGFVAGRSNRETLARLRAASTQ